MTSGATFLVHFQTRLFKYYVKFGCFHNIKSNIINSVLKKITKMFRNILSWIWLISIEVNIHISIKTVSKVGKISVWHSSFYSSLANKGDVKISFNGEWIYLKFSDMKMNYDFISGYVTKIMWRWKFNIMASVGLLRWKFNIMASVGLLRWKFNIMASVGLLCLFDHKDGNSISWRPSVC